jgi:heme-degrading monooxygenase HmoA
MTQAGVAGAATHIDFGLSLRRMYDMPHSIVRLAVNDYAHWKKVFDEAASLRKSYGSKGVRVFRSLDNPNELILLAEYEDEERVRQLFRSAEFRKATQRAGVSGPPDVTLADEVHQVPA